MNNFKNHAKQYIDAGFSVIPDKYGQKGAAIKEWTKYAHQMPTLGEIDAWSNAFEETNISVMLGEISGIIALDLDATDARILETVMPLLPDSPVVKRGAKGETRFYKYSGEMSQNIKFNGEMVLELLSTGKKTTLPPSTHPNGMSYTWVSDNLLSCNINNLPIVPPMLFSHLESLLKLKFPDLANESGKITSGRNAELSSYCAKLIQERIPIRDSIDKLIQFDKDKHEVPLFSDINELRHSEPFTNALQFYANHLSTINSKKFQKKEPYEVPLSGDLGKLQGRSAEVSEKSHAALPASMNLPQPSGVLKLLIDNLMSNMYIKQPEFAHAAALTLLAGLVSRKFIYSDLSPNLYTLILGDSGSGKNAPLQWVKRTLLSINAEDVLGAGDFVSDASLIDSLSYRPVRVDVVDEASKLLQVTTSGNASYDTKMADILCELYTSSNDKFLGRALASQDGSMRIKGACYRPNVNMICGTTPSGFSHAVTHKSIEKGLLGRFLIFFGVKDEIIDPVEYTTPLPEEAISTLKAIHAFAPSSSIHLVGGISQNVEMLTASEAARTQLNQVFTEVNALRSASHSVAVKPVVARIYQQIIKIAILHCVGRWKNGVPNIEVEDVVFAKDLIYYCFNNFNTVLDRYLFNSNTERYAKLVLRVIQENGEIARPALIYQTLALSNKERDEALKTLEACNQIMVDLVTTSNKEKQFVYRSVV
jgi:hypothetical protein